MCSQHVAPCDDRAIFHLIKKFSTNPASSWIAAQSCATCPDRPGIASASRGHAESANSAKLVTGHSHHPQCSSSPSKGNKGDRLQCF